MNIFRNLCTEVKKEKGMPIINKSVFKNIGSTLMTAPFCDIYHGDNLVISNLLLNSTGWWHVSLPQLGIPPKNENGHLRKKIDMIYIFWTF